MCNVKFLSSNVKIQDSFIYQLHQIISEKKERRNGKEHEIIKLLIILNNFNVSVSQVNKLNNKIRYKNTTN